MARVVVWRGNNPEEKAANFEEAMRKFKKVVNNSGILQEVKKREYYVKPGVAKRLKHEAAEKARNKKAKKKKFY